MIVSRSQSPGESLEFGDCLSDRDPATVQDVRMTVSLVVAGAGIRGVTYSRHAVAGGRARVVAVAEPDPRRRARFVAELQARRAS